MLMLAGYTTPSSPPQIEIKKLYKCFAILIDKDSNIWTPQIPVDVILPMQCNSVLVNVALSMSSAICRLNAANDGW